MPRSIRIPIGPAFFIGAVSLISLPFSAPAAAAAPTASEVIEVITDPLPIFDSSLGRGMPRDAVASDTFDPITVLLSRSRYWQEDGHLECIVRLTPDDGITAEGSRLEVRLSAADGSLLAEYTYPNLPTDPFIIYPEFPKNYTGPATIEFRWMNGDRPLAETTADFRVERRYAEGIREGSIPIHIENSDGITAAAMPMTAGIPFPRGALQDIANLRLIDADGRPVAAQFTERARWTKFGSLKWVLCDFTVDLDGQPETFYVEFGPAVPRQLGEPIAVTPRSSGGLPHMDSGRLRFDDGLWFDPQGDGKFTKVLGAKALTGAYVEHENGEVFTIPADGDFIIEEHGAEKIVIKSEGWLRSETDAEFCQYIVRYIIHRDSPLLRIFYTWIFTGDSHRDRIAAMGWQLPLAKTIDANGFLDQFGTKGAWLPGDSLLQYDYEHFAVVDGDTIAEFPGGRAPGVARASGEGINLYLGSKDFWQNYPSELEFADHTLWFNNWPRHNRSRRGTFVNKVLSTERGNPAALPSAARYAHEADDMLTLSEWKLNVVQARFAHEGEVLDFQLPQEFGEEPIWKDRGGVGWPKHDPDAVNAQGISRTEEIWVYLETDPSATTANAPHPSDSRALLEALNEERLRAFPDPAWIAASGAFYEMHPRDPENFPEEERAYELLALAPQLWVEQLGYYGMWLYGDIAAWSAVPLETRTPWLYRALRKAHHGWPYSWIPYARSGDPRLLKFAEAALRQLIDASYVHYVSDDVRKQDREGYLRRKGLRGVGPLAWAGAGTPMTRHMHTKVDSHLAAWYLTNYHRAMDNFLCWTEQTKTGGIMGMTDPNGNPMFPGAGRGTVALIRAYLEAYEATFDPWFFAAAHGMAESHIRLHQQGSWTGHFYATGDREFHRFTGDNEYADYFLAHAKIWADSTPSGSGWARMGAPKMHINAYAWEMTGDPHYARRAAHAVDWLPATVYDAPEPSYWQGHQTSGNAPAYTGWALEHYPSALAAVAALEPKPEAINNTMQIPGHNLSVAILKKDGQPLSLRMSANLNTYSRENTYELIAPDGNPFQSGIWNSAEPETITIPAEAPAGVYKWRLTDLPTSYAGHGFEIPLTPTDSPEVLIVEPSTPLRAFHHRNQLWFKVPKNIDTFTVTVPVGNSPRRVSVWNPNGERAWDYNHHPATHTGERTITGEITVRPEDAGKLWRITFPGSEPVILDPRIPPLFSVDRCRWFEPED